MTDETSVPQETDPILARRAKLEALRAGGVDPYPSSWDVENDVSDLIDSFRDDGPEVPARIAGRVVSLRGHGKTTFLHLADHSGRIQVYLKRDELGDDAYGLLEWIDLGDIVGISGTLFRTRTGEVTVRSGELRLLAKALRPLPMGKEVGLGDEVRSYHRVADIEFRYRQRYADLAIRPKTREVFVERARIISYLRGFLDDRGFLEVETPALQPLYGGATARPFTTHHNSLDMDLFLRIADELYLKRCIVGGFDRVYEIAKDFRNEGLSRFHNPEFTMLEFYQAHANYNDFMALTEDLVGGLVNDRRGGFRLTWQGRTVDVKPPWPRIRFMEALERAGVETSDLTREALAAQAADHGVDIAPEDGPGKILDHLFTALVEPDLEGPVFVIDFPQALSPLARRHPDDSRLVERFEAFLFGKEICNAFSELNDPDEQRERFQVQTELAAAGDLEATFTVDEDFIRALEYGMPPTAGLGMGVDRLVMFLTDQPSIRDVILFPLLRPEEGAPNPGEGQLAGDVADDGTEDEERDG